MKCWRFLGKFLTHLGIVPLSWLQEEQERSGGRRQGRVSQQEEGRRRRSSGLCLPQKYRRLARLHYRRLQQPAAYALAALPEERQRA